MKTCLNTKNYICLSENVLRKCLSRKLLGTRSAAVNTLVRASLILCNKTGRLLTMKISRCDLYKHRRRHTRTSVTRCVRHTSAVLSLIVAQPCRLMVNQEPKTSVRCVSALHECAACTRAHARCLLCLLSKLIKLSAARAVTQRLRFVQQMFSIKASRYGKCSPVFCCLGFSGVTGWGKGERVEAAAHIPNLAKKNSYADAALTYQIMCFDNSCSCPAQPWWRTPR